MLIDFGADVNVVDPEMSMTSGNVLVILSAPRRPYKTPMTPLMLAAARHDLPALRVLIESGAEINKVVVQEEQILGITVRETALSQAQKFNELREFRGMGRKEAVIQYLEEAGAKRPSDL
ncbi:MAG: ankyrin repeat domain-containing protein [Thiobacillus sp.]|nr:ankyrin repeat domain-containing protein [Thiobacillus sp.]